MRVVEQLAAIDLTLATFVVNNDFLGIRPILRYATPAMQEELLPQLARGRELAAFALTEPTAGSNPQGIAATGVAHANGGWQLSGTKAWSGSAGWAGVINVFVKSIDAQGKPQGIRGSYRITVKTCKIGL
jgi:alkylation response protein AidB-like acyl-CoA dehydrogenase